MPRQKKIYTIGYQDSTADALVDRLKKARIKVLVDVRAVPLSRKPGFSKNRLAARLAESGIRYTGLKGLGTPAEGRAAAREGRIKDMRRIFLRHLKTPEAVRDLAAAAAIAREERACLLCFERLASGCHRLLVAEEIARENGQSVENLQFSI